ncbi:GvpL/GvpF family gas vesicle protein [Streptomyces rapamycinicus]|uniref:GvpL/GvpF family gas vesicle protein n=1 Tax=Streptomyces rapamycinicus TaxID=1226757 RepID=UPI0032D8E9F8
MTEAATLTYAFAVCRGGDLTAPAEPFAELPGLGTGAPVRTVAAGPLTAVVQDVPAAGYDEEALRRRLSVGAELERCARAHHAVITAASALAPAVPLPLATVYLDDGRVREALGDRETSFLTALGRIAGRAEWGVKVYAPTGPPPAPAAVPAVVPAEGPGPGGNGRAYLTASAPGSAAANSATLWRCGPPSGWTPPSEGSPWPRADCVRTASR